MNLTYFSSSKSFLFSWFSLNGPPKFFIISFKVDKELRKDIWKSPDFKKYMLLRTSFSWIIFLLLQLWKRKKFMNLRLKRRQSTPLKIAWFVKKKSKVAFFDFSVISDKHLRNPFLSKIAKWQSSRVIIEAFLKKLRINLPNFHILKHWGFSEFITFN